jgi:hypothetical protein
VLAMFLGAGACRGAKVVECKTSVADYCAKSSGCALTWEEAQQDTSFCDATPNRDECGDYHAVSVGYVDVFGTYYYDRASGKLVAIVVVDGFADAAMCEAGPPTFVVPVCNGAGSEPLTQCLDGGADGAID